MPSRVWHDIWILLFVVIIIVGIFSGQGMLIGFSVMGLLFAGLAWTWNRLALRHITYEREFSSYKAFIGESIALKITLTNGKPVPLSSINMEDNFPVDIRLMEAEISTSHIKNSFRLLHTTSIGSYDQVTWEYRAECLKRGHFKIGPVRLQSGDILGLFRCEEALDMQDELLIYPRIVPLSDFQMDGAHPFGSTRSKLQLYEDVSLPIGVRDYTSGDPLKYVDWKATAKAQRVQSKTFDISSSAKLMLVVGVDTTAYYWQGYSEVVLERVITAAASLASAALEEKYNVGMFSNGSPVVSGMPMRILPSRSPDQLSVVLEALAGIRPIASGSLSVQLGENIQFFPVGSTLLVVSGFVPDELVDQLQTATRKGFRVVVFYVGDEECPQIEGVNIFVWNEYFKNREL